MLKILTRTIVYACIILCYSANSVIYAQNNIILREDVIDGYVLISQVEYDWPISSDSLTNSAIKQKWQDTEKGVFYILYCEFENEILAIKGTEYMANSCASPFIEGSPTDGIYGKNYWVALDGSAVCFQKGKYSIKVFKPINFQQEDMNRIDMFSNQIIKQIEDSSSIDSGK